MSPIELFWTAKKLCIFFADLNQIGTFDFDWKPTRVFLSRTAPGPPACWVVRKIMLSEVKLIREGAWECFDWKLNKFVLFLFEHGMIICTFLWRQT